MNPFDIRLTRRRVLASLLGLAAGCLVLSPRDRSFAANDPTLVWVWQFSDDGEPNQIGGVLVQLGMGIILKTHDGTAWMSEYDTSEYAVSGPVQVRTLADYFEAAGVPFHAWAVLRGENPLLEAQMAADVLASGARSLYLDPGPEGGAWTGDEAAARQFGEELRRLQPDGKIVLVADPRPWFSNTLPMAAFAEFSDEVAIQALWESYDTQSDREAFASNGFTVPEEGITPEFVYAAGYASLASIDLPKGWIADASSPNPDSLARFRDVAWNGGATSITLWRYGTAANLGRLPMSAPESEPDQPSPSSEATGTHVVQIGETLSEIAITYDVDVEALVAANDLEDPDFVVEGAVLTIP